MGQLGRSIDDSTPETFERKGRVRIDCRQHAHGAGCAGHACDLSGLSVDTSTNRGLEMSDWS